MKIIDARGFLCPKPLMLTKKGLAEINFNEQISVLIDNETSKINVERFLKDNNMKVDCIKEDKHYQLTVTKTEEVLKVEAAEEYCEPSSKKIGKYVFLFKDNKVADDELGEILSKAYFDVINELDSLPEKIIFYHKGVKLVLDNSPFLEHLREIEYLGVKILICGTCVNYYNVIDRVSVGTISNAYDILTALSNAHHIVTL
jgi:selenium metabolism protein YedF